MANEDLFPPLDWSKWDTLSVANNQQRYDDSFQSEAFEKLRTEYKNALKSLSEEAYLSEKANIKRLQEEIHLASKNTGLKPYNYVPPRHALEPHLGFTVDPNNAYRILGEQINIKAGVDPSSVLKNKTVALQDFLTTGQIRGNPTNVNGGRVYSPPSPEMLKQYEEDLFHFNKRANAPKVWGIAGFNKLGSARYDWINPNGNKELPPVLPKGKELPQAYFMPRHPQPTYYTQSVPPIEDYQGMSAFANPYAQQIGTRKITIPPIKIDGRISQNTVIEINKDFAPINQTVKPASANPLYYMGNQYGDDAKAFRGRGGLWSENTGAGAHITANPRENPSFFDVANPKNRKGIRILQESAPAINLKDKIAINNRAIYGKVKLGTTGESIPSNIDPSLIETNAEGYFTTVKPNQTAGTAPEAAKIKWDTKYDRITPFSKRPIATHLANVKAETEIFYNASKTAPLSTKLGSLGAMAGLGGAAKAVGLVAGGLTAPIQIGMQINALNEKNMMDREYGHSDPLALRPLVDLALSGIGNNQTPAEGYRAMGKMVADPEWQMRNPISAVPYNLLQGNLEPLKAFAGGLKDFYTPSFLK